MQSSDDRQQLTEREQKIMRFLFANGISLTTLVSIAFISGMYFNALQQIEKNLEALQVDMTQIKLKIAGYDVDLSHLKRPYYNERNGTK